MFGLCGCGTDSEEEEARRQKQRKIEEYKRRKQLLMQRQNMPASEGQVVPEFSEAPAGLEPQEFGGTTRSNAAMKTADYRCEMDRGGANSSCSKLESADQNDIIYHHRGPSGGPANPFGAPPPGAPAVPAPPPAHLAPYGVPPGDFQEQIPGTPPQEAQPGDVGAMQKQSSSSGTSSDKNVQPKKPSDQSTTESTTYSQEVASPGPEAIVEEREALSSDASHDMHGEKPGIRILTTEKITRRQVVYNVEKDGLDDANLGRTAVQERGPHDQDPGQHKSHYAGPTHDQSKPPDEVLQQALDTTIYEDSEAGKVRLNVTCKSSTALHKSGTNITAAQSQHPPVYSAEYLAGYPPVPERFGEYYPPPGYSAPPPPGYAGAPYYPPPPPPPPPLPPQGYYPSYRPEYYPPPPPPPPPPAYPAPNYPTSPSYRLGPAYWKHPWKRGSRAGPTINTDIIFDINVNKLPSKGVKSDGSNGSVSTSSTTTTSSSKAKEKPQSKSKSSTSSNRSSGKVKSNGNVKSNGSKSNSTDKSNSKAKSNGSKSNSTDKSNSNANSNHNNAKAASDSNNNKSKKRQKRAAPEPPPVENDVRRKSNSRSGSQAKSGSQPGSNQSVKSNSNQNQRDSNNNSKQNSDQRGSSLCRCGHDSRKCKACEPPMMEEVTE